MSKKFYAPVESSGNYVSKEVKKWYASVGGVSKKIVKAYCSVGGLSKLFYVDGGAVTGKTKVVFLENYQSDVQYTLDFADIEDTIRYYFEELAYINEGARAYAETQTATAILPRFFLILDAVTNAIEDIVTYVENQITNETEINISSALISSGSNVYTLRINFDIYNSSFTGETVVESASLDTVGGFFRYNATPTVSRSGKRIQLNVNSANRRLVWSTSTNTRTAIQIGQNTTSYNSSPPYVYPLFPVIGNIGIGFEPNGLPNYLARWDFNNRLAYIDKTDNIRMNISGVSTAIGDGAVWLGDSSAFLQTNASWEIGIPTSNHDTVMEMDISEMDLRTTTNDAVLIRIYLGSSTTVYEEFIYSISEQIWMLHTRNGSTHVYGRSNISDMNYFENSTVRLIISSSGLTVYKDDVEQICTCTGLSRTNLSGTPKIGDHIDYIGIKSIRFYTI